MLLIQGREQLTLLKRACFYSLHHVCAIIYCDFLIVISNLVKIQSVKADTLHGTVFAAFLLVYFLNPEAGGYKRNRMIQLLAVGK